MTPAEETRNPENHTAMKVNFPHDAAGVADAIQNAVNKLAEWGDVQQDPKATRIVRRADRSLRDALRDILALRDGKIPAPDVRTVLTRVNEEGAVVSIRVYDSAADARRAMGAELDNEAATAEREGLCVRFKKLGEYDAELQYGETMSYDWQILTLTI